MIKTESTRRILKTDYELPHEVVKALKEWNRTHAVKLDILFDDMTGGWQIYQIKSYGVRPDDDVLCWQMSAPTLGTGITPGIFTWLIKYDTSNGGLLDREELKTNWYKFFLEAQAQKDVKLEAKREDDMHQAILPLISKLAVQREQIVVPKPVGWNKKKGQPILAVPKGMAKAIKRQKARIANGV